MPPQSQVVRGKKTKSRRKKLV
uniref:Uncharacterized protein n=1 Tax=Zea mays TaxID=4577 RepID=C0PAB1_MAIZE|nr:unknown [Zea mays]